jgi:hypothetical protein
VFVSARERPLGIGCPFRVSTRRRIVVWVERSHFAVGPFTSAVWFSSGGRRWSRLNSQSTPLFGFAFLQSITQRHLADRPRPVSHSLGLLLPSAHEEPKVHISRALPARFVPPSGFGDPLDGFLPSIPRRLSFTPAALLGFTLRSFLLPDGRPYVSARPLPRTVPPTGGTTYRSRRPALRAAVPGVYLPEVPWRPSVGLAPRPLAAPLGLALRGFALGDLDRDFARSPLSRFTFSRLSASRPAPQSVDQSPPASARHPACSHVGASGGTLRGFPHLYGPAHSNPVASRAIFFTSHRVVHYCRPTDAL